MPFGTVYFAAGIWPSEGIYVYALDARTGRTLWCNDRSGGLYMPQPHGTAHAKSGISAQGYLTILGSSLLVPTGRAVPAVLDCNNGRLTSFLLQENSQAGGSQVIADERLGMFFCGKGLFHRDGRSARSVRDSAVVVAPYGVLSVSKGRIIEERYTEEKSVDRKGATVSSFRLAGRSEMMDVGLQPRSLIAAAGTLVAGAEGRVRVCKLDSGKTVLDAELEGTVYGLAVANEQLYASTDHGCIYCFSADEDQQPASITPKTVSDPYPAGGLYADAAKEVLTRTGISVGYCLDLGCGEGALACELARRSDLHIVAVDSEQENVAAAREKLQAAGLYGSRVTVLQMDPARTHLPNCFANLIVSARLVAGPGMKLNAQEVARLLRPHGGNVAIGRAGALRMEVAGAPEGEGTWTHQYCDPANTTSSRDRLVKAPLAVRWFDDLGFVMPNRHGQGPAPLYMNGCLYVEGLDGLLCVDAFNGRRLWEHRLPGLLKHLDQEHLMGTAVRGGNLCLTECAVFLAVDDRCLKIAPASGELIATFQLPVKRPGRKPIWGFLACADGVLYGSAADPNHVVRWAYMKSDMSQVFSESTCLFAVDAGTGALRWKYEPDHSIRNNSIAIGRGKVFLIDRPKAEMDLFSRAVANRRGLESPAHNPGRLVAFDAKTGKPLWTKDEDIFGTTLALSEEHDVLLMTYAFTSFKLPSEIGGRMAARSASDGKLLWDIATPRPPYANRSRPMVSKTTVYLEPHAYDLLTGKPSSFALHRSYNCGICASSENIMLFRSGTLGYVNLAENKGLENYGGVRPGCWINAIPVGGMVLMPDATDQCRCSYLIKSSLALEHRLPPPIVTLDRSKMTLRAVHEEDGVEIRYSSDGTPPCVDSPAYSGPLVVGMNRLYKFKAFKHGLAPSETVEFVVAPRLEAVAHWKLDEPAGSTTAVDGASGFDLAGTPTFGVAGVAGSGTRHGGPLTRSYEPKLNTESFTVSLWFKPESDGMNYIYESHHGVSPNYDLMGFYLFVNEGEVAFTTGAGAHSWHYVRRALPGEKGAWYHIVASYDAAARRKTLCVSRRGGAFDSQPASAPAAFGVNPSAPLRVTRSAKGDLDDIRYFDEALDARQSKWLFQHPGERLMESAP